MVQLPEHFRDKSDFGERNRHTSNTSCKMSYMNYRSTITSKGTITLAAPLRKALKMMPGQEVKQSLTKDNKIVIEPSTTIEDFEAVRAMLLSKIPKSKRGLSISALKKEIEKARIAEYRRKARR